MISKNVVTAIDYVYNENGMLSKKTVSADGSEVVYNTEYPENANPVIKIRVNGRNVESHSKTDSFGRKVFDEIQLGSGFVSRQFSYHAGKVTDEHKQNGKLKSSPTTSLVSQIVLSNGTTLSYAYDAEEHITSVTEMYEVDDIPVVKVTSYTYDALGQLESEIANGVTTKFQYDNYGNITAKGIADENGDIIPETKIEYTYDEVWKDKLTSFNGEAIVYDAQGNPTEYLGHNLTWEKGRQLKSFDNHNYTYNANGIRTSKTVDGIRHDFVLEGAKILKETWNDNTLVPLYDNSDSVCGIVCNGISYFFLKNLQGDIIAITNSDGETVARYSYDAWGKCTVDYDNTGYIASINPFRYRGYYLDKETNLYYLNSRYYDANTGRFINADSPEYVSTQGGNLFAYCGNCPTKNADYLGFCYVPVDTEEIRNDKNNPFLAIGLQLAVSLGSVLIGIEALWSTKNGKFYLFLFIGGNRNLNVNSLRQTEAALIQDLLMNLSFIPKFGISNFGKIGKFSIAVSFIAVLGNKHAKFPSDYCGWFTGISLSIFHITASGAYAKMGNKVIGSLGLGVTSNKADIGISQLYYIQLTGRDALENNIKTLQEDINYKIGVLKLFAVFFG